MRLKRYPTYIYIILLCCFAPGRVFAQAYGLGFLSHETVQDKRTGLDLSPGKTLCFKDDFELSFDFAFLPNRENYFGYIIRLINNDKQNVDLLYDRRMEGNHFKLIIGDTFSNISFNLDENKLLTGWTNFKLRFDAGKQQLTLRVGKASYSHPFKLSRNNCFKILYGSNDYLDFKTNDVPPMKLRDIRITEGGKLTYHWLLDQSKGSNATEEINGNDAGVVNPLWIKKMHLNWESLQRFTVNGAASIAFNPGTETVYVISTDSLLSYTVPSSKLKAPDTAAAASF